MQRIFIDDPSVMLYETGLANDDMLGLTQLSGSLSKLVSSTDQPLVIALDGPWGSGKSFFLKRWSGAHRIENKCNDKIVYIDAHAIDFMPEPLIALTAAMSGFFPESNRSKQALERVGKIAAIVAKPLGRVLLAAGTAGATEYTGPVLDAAIEVAGGEAIDTVDQIWKEAKAKHGAFAEFRKALIALVETLPQHTNLVLVVDELDRCRPDFAIDLLEMLKHFWSVPRVHFVLGVNLEELENSVRHRFGTSDSASRYLEKYISATFTIPTIDESTGSASVVGYFRRVASTKGIHAEFIDELARHIEFSNRGTNLTLRDANRLVNYATLCGSSFSNPRSMYVGSFVVLSTAVFLRAIESDRYRKLLAGQGDLATILDAFRRPDEDRYEFEIWWQRLTTCWNHFFSPGSLSDEDKRERFFGPFTPRSKKEVVKQIRGSIERVQFAVTESAI